MLSSLAPARRRLVLGVAGLVLAALVAGAITLIVTRGGDANDSGPVSQQQPGPVVLVPGYGGSTSALDELAGRLRAQGRDATVVRLPGDGRGDLDAQADTLGDTVADVRERTGARSVDVIGYSAGGVVARLWAKEHGGANVARRIVTLGSPQHGTELATLGSALPSACPTACRQLAPGNPLLARLNIGDETPAGPTWVSIWTQRDRVVTPPDSARLAGAINVPLQTVCADNTAGHGDLPTDADVVRIVLAELATGPPVTPTTALCAT